ncbi:MAG: energy transducer TonB [Flavobacteriales bacterium]|nr:energy transducer TonB [Flavobacteriales bacterium]
MRCILLLAAVLALDASAQFGVGIMIPTGRSTRRPGTVPDSMATYLSRELDLHPRSPGGIEQWVSELKQDPSCRQDAGSMTCRKHEQVVVRFIVERDGRLTDPVIVKGRCAALEQQILCAIAASPRWEPGRIDYHKVRSRMQVTIRFP